MVLWSLGLVCNVLWGFVLVWFGVLTLCLPPPRSPARLSSVHRACPAWPPTTPPPLPAAHPTVVSVSSSAYTSVVDSRIANYFKANPQHAVIALFFVLRTILLPALIKKKPLPIALPEDKNEEMVDFGLGNGAGGGKGENGEIEVQFGKEKSVKASGVQQPRREGLRQRN